MSSIAKQRINGKFYPLTQEQLMWMYKNKCLTKVGFVYLALKLQNPFCDRPIDINVKEFGMSWGIPESSIYEALGKLRELKALKFLNKRVKIQWEQDFDCFTEESTYSQQEEFSRNTEFILGLQNKSQDYRINSVITENEAPEPLPVKDSDIPHTIHTSTNSSEFVEEEFLGCEGTQEPSIKKPILKTRDVPEQPPAPSTINPDLQTHLEAATQGIEPAEDIKEQLLEHPGYAPTYAIYARRYGWERKVSVSAIPDYAKDAIRKIKERGKYKVPKQ